VGADNCLDTFLATCARNLGALTLCFLSDPKGSKPYMKIRPQMQARRGVRLLEAGLTQTRIGDA
jgi:hypothetical protein